MACCIASNPGAAGAPYGPPVAAFTPSDETIGAYGTVGFADLTTGIPTSWSWLVNGAQFSTAKNPSYYFSVRGIFVVVLIATNAYGSNSTQHTITVV